MKTSKLIPKPAFFDMFGIVVFIFIIWIGYTSLTLNQPLSPVISSLVLAIGVIGLVIDVLNVYRTYVK